MTRRVIAVLIAVVFAAIGAGAVLLYVRSADERALEGKEARTVLIADRAIPAGTTAAALRDQNYVREELMPVATVPEDAMSAIPAADDALVATAAVQPGFMLLRSMLGTAVSKGSGIAMPEGMLAVDARITSTVFSPQSLVPGARVVVFYTYSPLNQDRRDIIAGSGLDRARDATIITRVLFPDVEVISVKSEEPADGDGPAVAPPKNDDGLFTVTLALNQRDTAELANAVALGGLLNVALRNEASIVKDDGGVDNRVLFD
jgi:pilus assembly protein CpaB